MNFSEETHKSKKIKPIVNGLMSNKVFIITAVSVVTILAGIFIIFILFSMAALLDLSMKGETFFHEQLKDKGTGFIFTSLGWCVSVIIGIYSKVNTHFIRAELAKEGKVKEYKINRENLWDAMIDYSTTNRHINNIQILLERSNRLYNLINKVSSCIPLKMQSSFKLVHYQMKIIDKHISAKDIVNAIEEFETLFSQIVDLLYETDGRIGDEI